MMLRTITNGQLVAAAFEEGLIRVWKKAETLLGTSESHYTKSRSVLSDPLEKEKAREKL